MEIWYTILIGFFSLISGIISSKGALYDKRKKVYNRLNGRGRSVLIFGLLIILISYIQYRTNKASDAIKTAELTLERNSRDSIISKRISNGIDSNRRILYNDLSIAFSNQNLKLDTVTKEIVKLRDSAKTTIIKNPEIDPVLIIPGMGVKSEKVKDSLRININLLSTVTNSIIDNISVIIEVQYNDGSLDNTQPGKFVKGRVVLPKDQPINSYFQFPIKQEVSLIKILLFGNYKNQGTNKIINIKDAYSYILSSKKLELILGWDKDLLFKKYGID